MTILTVTLNPAVDISYELETLMQDTVNRVEKVGKSAGGKGLNVTRVLNESHAPVLATGFLGGELGRYIEGALDNLVIQHRFCHIAGETRNCIAILHEGKQTEILETGPSISESEARAFLGHIAGLLHDVDTVAISGSLPKGLPTDYYVKLLTLCAEKERKVVLDTSGSSLEAVLHSNVKPTAIKPNNEELSQLLGRQISTSIDDLKDALSQSLFDGVEWIVVSLGADGAFAKHGQIFYKVSIPTIAVANPVGSGDATVAGIASALSQHFDDVALLKHANVLGMLNAQEARTGHVNMDNYSTLYEQITVEVI